MTHIKSGRSQAGYSLAELLTVLAVTGVIAAIAVPMTGNALTTFRLSGDARSVNNALSLSKMRAAATFSQARLYVDLGSNGFRVERWDRASSTWKGEIGSTYLAAQDSFGFGTTGTAPPNTQTTIAQPSQCLDNTSHAIGNTACVLFNSRGIPIDTTGAPTGTYGIYVTDGSSAVYGSMISATGMIQLWRTPTGATPTWSQQ